MSNFANISTGSEKIYTIKRGDPNFLIQGKYAIINRAGFEISADCPEQYKRIVVDCYNRGWLTPVANITEREKIFMGLAND